MVNRSKIAGWGVGVGILFGLAIGFLVFHHPHDHKPPWFTSHELTDDEKAQVKKIAVETFKKDESAVHELEQRTADLKKHLQDSSVSDVQLHTEFAKINQLRSLFADHRFGLDLKVRKIVGPARILLFDPLGSPAGPPPRPRHGDADEERRGPRSGGEHDEHDPHGDGPHDARPRYDQPHDDVGRAPHDDR